MLWLAAASIVAAKPVATATPSIAVQAIATVRIVSGVRLKLDSPTNLGAPQAHDSRVMADGSEHPARLIEFQ